MKNILLCVSFLLVASLCKPQDKENVERACLNYLEGFYEGDTTKLITALKPTLYKIGFWKNKTTGVYDFDGQMSYRQALNYAKNVLDKKHFAEVDAPKKVEVLDIMKTTAAAKVTAWWGIDYILLSKQNGKWMIEEVLWEGPLEK